MKNVLWWLIGGSRGGQSRAEILQALKEHPHTATQLVQRLELDYTTVRFHLGLLTKNGMVVAEGGKYNKVYALTPSMELHWPLFEEIAAQIGGRRGKDYHPPPPPSSGGGSL